MRPGGKVLWDKKALDVAVDRLSGSVAPLVDPFREGLKRASAEAHRRKGARRKWSPTSTFTAAPASS